MLQWISHPVKEEPGRNWTVLFFVALTGTAMWLTTTSLYWVGLGVALILVAIRQWFLPTHYTLDGEGVEMRCLFYRRRKPWREIRRADPGNHGVLLSPFAFRTRLESFRGMFVRFSGNRDKVMEFVDRHINKDAK